MSKLAKTLTLPLAVFFMFSMVFAGIGEQSGLPEYNTDSSNDESLNQRVRLPEEVEQPSGNRACSNWNESIAYLWYGSPSVGKASLFPLEAGTYALESVTISDYSNAWIGLTEATATVNVDIADADGNTVSTIATGSLVTDGTTGTLDFTGTSFELTVATLVKVSVYSATNAGDVNYDGVDDYAPFLLSEDGYDPSYYCGTDTIGTFALGYYDWDIEFCATMDCNDTEVTFNLVDSWGDGWNGNNLIFNGETMTIGTGDSASYVFCLSDNNYTYSYDAAGSYQSENTWTVTLGDGTVLSSGDGADGAADYAFTVGDGPPTPDIVINEIHYNPSSSQGSDDDYEFLELYNTTASDIDLTGYSITQGIDYTFVSGDVITAGGYLVLAKNAATYTGSIQWTSGSLGNGGEDVEVTDASGTVVDYVDYDDGGDWTGLADGDGPSLELIDINSDNTDPANWQASWVTGGTPGAANSVEPDPATYTIVEIQTPGEDGDASQHVGEYVETNGVVTAWKSYFYFIQDGVEDYSGVYVYDGNSDLTIGDNVTIRGTVAEYNGLTQIGTVTSTTINSSGNALPAPMVLSTGAVALEGHEGMLVSAFGTCTALSADPEVDHWLFTLDDGSGDAYVDDGIYTAAVTVGAEYQITGPVTYYYGNFQILPRDSADVASPCSGSEITRTFVAGSWASEVSWDVVDTLGTEVDAGVGADTDPVILCLAPGVYTVNMHDSYGDGWNGGVISFTDPNGTVIGSGGLTDGAEGTFDFEVIEVELALGSLQGIVTNAATGNPLAGAHVTVGNTTIHTSSDGSYLLETTVDSVAVVDVLFDRAGYLDASFTVTMTEDDTLELSAALVPLDSISYFTGFESVDEDPGVFATEHVDFTTGFTYWDASMADTVEVEAPEGTTFVATQGYDVDLVTYWMNTDPLFIPEELSTATIGLKLNVMTEENWDYVYVLAYSPSFNPASYYIMTDLVTGGSTYYTGNSDGWFDVEGDLSFLIGRDDVKILVYLASDESFTEGFGFAFDSVSVSGGSNPRPWVENLTAESFVDDQIDLSWSPPAGGTRTLTLGSINIENPIIPNPDYVRGNKGATKINIEEVEVEFSSGFRTDRDLVSYNVYRTDEFLWSDYSDFEFVGNTTTAGYTDASVDNHALYYYFVSAVYDEGQSAGSNWAAAGAGSVIDHSMADLAIDFEDSTFGMWEVQTDADNGWGLGRGGTGTYEPDPRPDGGLFAFIDDDDVGSGVSSMSRLVSPFFNLGDADQATLSFDYFAHTSDYGQEMHLLAWVGWDTWIYLGELTENGEWQSVSVDLSEFAGTEHLRVYFWYTDNGGWASSVAVDNIVVETLDGPAGLTLASTLDDVTLSWTGVGSQAMRVNEYPDGVNIAEKELAQQLNVANGEIVSADFNINSADRTMSRAQGDSIGNPFVIDALPYSISASTEGFTDDYDEACNAPWDDVGGFDVVYELTLSEDLVDGLVVDLCESYYDTKVYIFANGDTNSVVACSDDYCTASHGQEYTSFIQTDALAAGTYHIVVDGWNAASYGTYVMEVYEADPPPQPLDVMYNVYKDEMMVAEGLDTTVFVDGDATLEDEACYVVTAMVRTLGTEGDTVNYVETGPSNEECGALVNAAPEAFSLLSPSAGDTIVIDQSNLGDDQPFAWGASVDPNGTAVEYEVCVTVAAPFDQFCDDNGTSTAQFVPLADIAAYIDSLNQAAGTGVVLTFNWTVYASDGVNETEASDGPRTVTFDAGWVLSVDEEMGIPDVFALHQNYPNPFNPVTTIRFDVPQENHIRMDIYNILGQRVRTLVNSDMQAGYHTIRWNGTNDMGKPLSSGMYIYRIHSSEFTSVKKLVLMK